MKTSSAKSKGRRLCASFAEVVRKITGLEPDDVRVTPSGVTGPDLMLSPLAKKRFPFEVEAKNQESLNIWAAIKQAEEHAKVGGGIPMVVFARNRTAPYVAVPMSELHRIFNVPKNL